MSAEKDELSAAIDYNRHVGNQNYARVLEHIRGRLEALESRSHSFQGMAWLIECSFKDGITSYYCGPADWCSNPNHAVKFKTREEAESVSNTMDTIGERRVADHSWG